MDQRVTIHIYLGNNTCVVYYNMDFICIILLDSKVTCSGMKSTKPS